MTNSTFVLDSHVAPAHKDHATTIRLQSKTCAGVWFEIRRVTFGARLELLQKLRYVIQNLELHGGYSAKDRVETAILEREILLDYVLWGLVRVEGLLIDGRELKDTPDLIRNGPEFLTAEIAGAIQREIGLNEDDRKN